MLSEKVRRIFGIIGRWMAILALVAGVCGFAYYRSVKSGLQAEAHLMISYISTLQNAYELENGHFVGFDYYGAAIQGNDHCVQPEGAKLLGFQIAWCTGAKRVEPVRYAYKVLLNPAPDIPYAIVATSGSDNDRESFICYGRGETDEWVAESRKKREHTKDCDPDP